MDLVDHVRVWLQCKQYTENHLRLQEYCSREAEKVMSISKVSCELHIILRSPHDKVSIFYMLGVNIRKQPLFEFNKIHVVCTVLLNGVANGVVTLFLHIISYDVNSLHV